MQKFYEIREVNTNELLVDELTEEKAIELLMAYQNFYGAGSVYITSYVVPPKAPQVSRKQNYKNDYMLLFVELQN